MCSGEDCNSPYIQNKKYNLCGDCVFKKSHNGKSKQEVYQEKASKKLKKVYEFQNRKIEQPKALQAKKYNINYIQDEVSRQNEINQNLAELEARREAKKNGEVFDLEDYESGLPKTFVYENPLKQKISKKKQKPIKQVSTEQRLINNAYKAMCIEMDHSTEPLCSGCGKYQGGDIRLSHSHIISREDCRRIGRLDLISTRDNLHYHCMSFGDNTKGCHSKWESPVERKTLLDYEENINYIKSIDRGLYLKYINE